MKKRLLVAAVMAAMTISAVPAFAAPTFSGDANIEYNNLTDHEHSSLTNRIRLSVDSAIADNLYLHGRAVMNNNLHKTDDLGNVQTNGVYDDKQIVLEQAYLGGKLGNFDVKVGRQPLWLGKGALSDINGINGIQVATAIKGSKLSGFFGNDANATVEQNVVAADFGSSYGGVNFGASYLKQGDYAKFMGLNADTKIAENTVLNVEYVKNTDTKANGYLAEVKVGNAVKKGDLDYSVAYRNIENGAVSNYTTDDNYNDSKGIRVKANYKVANNATLTAFQDFTDNQASMKNNKTNVEFSVNF